MINVLGGKLYIDGLPCREVGWNCYFEFLKTLANNSDLTYQTSLAKLREYNVRVVRCLVTPLWAGGTGGWGTYNTAGGMNATYYSLLDAFMDECAENGIQVVMPLVWRHATLPDLFSETVSQIGTASSASLTYAVSFATEIATRYKNHDACGMWQVGNEWTNYAKGGGLPTVNVGNGTPASYSDPDDVLTVAQCMYAVNEITNAIRAADSERAILASAGRFLGSVPSTSPYTPFELALDHGKYNTGSTDCYGLHIYTGSEFGSEPMYGLRDYITTTRRAAGVMPVVVDEIGVSEDDVTKAETWGEIASLINDPAGPELTLLWNWGDLTTWTSGDARWDVYPGVNKDYQASDVMLAQRSAIRCNHKTGQEFTPSAHCRFKGGTSTPDCVYFPSGFVSPSSAFTVTFWERYLGGITTTGTFWRVLSFGDESTYGFYILRNSSSGRLYAEIRLASGAVNTHGKAPVSERDRWMHHSISWNPASSKLRHVVFGRYTAADVTHAALYQTGVDRKFVLGAGNSLSNGNFMDLYDVRLYSDAISLRDSWLTSVNRSASITPVVRALYAGIDEGATTQGSPEWFQREITSTRRPVAAGRSAALGRTLATNR